MPVHHVPFSLAPHQGKAKHLNIDSTSSIADPEERLKTVLQFTKQKVANETLSMSDTSQKMDRVFLK